MRVLIFLLQALLFLVLLAFAMNNLQPSTVNWFFSSWTAPLVIVVLVAFACGAAFGVLAMTPAWWRHRRQALRRPAASSPAGPLVAPATPPAPDMTQVRDGL